MASYTVWARNHIRDSCDAGHAALIKAIVNSALELSIALLRQGADQKGDIAYNTVKTAYIRCSEEAELDASLIVEEIEKIQLSIDDEIHLDLDDNQDAVDYMDSY